MKKIYPSKKAKRYAEYLERKKKRMFRMKNGKTLMFLMEMELKRGLR